MIFLLKQRVQYTALWIFLQCASVKCHYTYFHRRCSNDLADLITTSVVHSRNTKQTIKAHPYKVQTTELITAASLFPNTLVTALFGIVALLTIYHFWFQSLRHVKLANKIPGPKAYPIIGNALVGWGLSAQEMMRKVLEIHRDLRSDVARAYLGPKLYIGLINPKDIELILGSNVHLEKSPEYDLFKPWLGQGLLISKGEKWRTHRKMIAPTFHSSILKSFMPIFNKNANNLLNQLEKEKGNIFDIHDFMSGATVDILLETAMGVQKTKEDNTGYDYAKAVMELSKEKKEDYFLRESKGESSLYKEVVKATDAMNNQNERTENYKYIRDDLEDIEENDIGEKKRLAFLDFMIEASQTSGNKLTDEEIKEEVDTIMFEGHDTTAAGSSFVLCILGVHQNIQEKCIAELKEIFHDDWNRPITFADTLQMKYLERVIMETLRLYPPVPLISRRVNEDVQLASKKYVIPAGTTVLIGQYLVHRHPQYWDNPEVFNPDNFLPEKCQDRHYYAYIPFSAGPRSCVGRKYALLKLKVIIASVLRKYKVNSLKTEENFKLQADIILKREDGFSVTIADRIMS